MLLYNSLQFSPFNYFLAAAAVWWCLWKMDTNSDGLWMQGAKSVCL